ATWATAPERRWARVPAARRAHSGSSAISPSRGTTAPRELARGARRAVTRSAGSTHHVRPCSARKRTAPSSCTGGAVSTKPLMLRCPICGAPRGRSCLAIFRGRPVRELPEPHRERVHLATEEAPLFLDGAPEEMT